MEIDATLYPDREPPERFEAPEEKADHLLRVCGAFDFGVVPDGRTLELLRGWREVFDRFPLGHSPAYHALRAFYGWPPVERAPSFAEPGYVKLDAAEGRTDGFEDRV